MQISNSVLMSMILYPYFLKHVKIDEYMNVIFHDCRTIYIGIIYLEKLNIILLINK